MGRTRSRTGRAGAPCDGVTDTGEADAAPRADTVSRTVRKPQADDARASLGVAGVGLLFEGLFSCLRRGSRRL